MNNLTFFVLDDNTQKEVYPFFDEIKYSLEKWNDNTHDFKLNLSNEFIFEDKPNGVNAQNKIELTYTFFKKLADAFVPKVDVIVKYFSGGVYKVFMLGTINILNTDVNTFDRAAKTFTTKIELKDVHNDLINKQDNTFNIFDVPGASKKSAYLIGEDVTYYNGYLLKDIIQYGFEFNNLPLNIKSDFAPFLNILNIDNLLIFQKSDVKRPDATQRATKGKVSLKYIFDWLTNLFNLKYTIFPNGEVQFLHETELNTFYGKVEIDNNIVDLYNNSFGFVNIPKSEIFGYDEFESEEFVKYEIEYNINKTEKENHVVNNLCNDLRFIINNAARIATPDATDEISDDGFVLIATDDLYNVISGGGVYNSPLSTEQLFNLCHKSLSYISEYKINNVETSAPTSRKVKKREIDIIANNLLSPNNFIFLKNNIYLIDSIQANGDVLTLSLLYR